MGFCIYHKKANPDLRFDKEEHVIPAGLGGIRKLEKGTVSDEANEQFSKVEAVGLRNSIIALNRMNNGPGKRGSLNIKKVKNPIMRVIEHENKLSTIDLVLGFIFAGESVVISQLTTYFDFTDNSISYQYLASNFNNPSVEHLQIELNEKLIKFLENKKRKYKLVHMPHNTDKNFVHIGFYEGKWYVATTFKPLILNAYAHDMLPILYKLREKLNCKENLPNHIFIEKPVFRFKEELDTDFEKFYFMYLKTAFNALALFKGTEFVCNKIFDEIRESIINVSGTDKFINSNKDHYDSKIKTYIKKFPRRAHYIIICAQNDQLNAYVSFYGEIPVMIELTDKYYGENFTDGLICDWQNRREFRLDI
ncbi:hypothetical protein ACQKJG_30485 [Priestia megaterium]|uniref:hypothetical protein n=1 Tax=Priestia megaterium TaxID=1404 RepID=UPI003D062D03